MAGYTGAGQPAVLFLSFQIFEVTSTTRVRDLSLNIVKKLRLASSEGYSIFVKTHNKVHMGFLIANVQHFHNNHRS